MISTVGTRLASEVDASQQQISNAQARYIPPAKSFSMNANKFLPILAVAVTVLWSPLLAEEPPSKPTHVKALMQVKLDRAKGILEGLTLEDYDKIASNARALKLLSMESGWNVYQTDQYITLSQHFRQNADRIIEAAGEQDIHRAALGYVALTVSCVECHSFLRKNKVEQKREPE